MSLAINTELVEAVLLVDGREEKKGSRRKEGVKSLVG